MKKIFLLISLLFTTICLTACATEAQSVKTTENNTSTTVSDNIQPNDNSNAKLIRLTTDNAQTITMELNDSTAAIDLYKQLPLTIELENYSSNEKIFYPPQKLSTENIPLAQSKIGTLAYYEPWGDVVIFYGEFHSNHNLYELGHVITGEDMISELSGTVTIETIPNS